MTRLTANLLPPFSHVRGDLDRIFSGVFDRELGASCRQQATADWLPAIDISEQDDTYRVEAELPGFQLDDIEVTVEGRKLVISGQKAAATEQPTDEATASEETETPTSSPVYHVQERRSGEFTRTITLPVAVDATKTDAEMHNGILTLNVPKAQAARQHKIDIRSR